MPAEGFAASAGVSALEPGIYIDLPEHVYVRDRALSGSAFKKLLFNPPDYQWDHPDNPLYETSESEPRFRGTAVHKALLEGMSAYEATYGVEPDRTQYPDALDTATDLKEWLRSRGQKLTGLKAELVQRVLDCDPTAPIWDAIVQRELAGRLPISFKADASIRLLAKVVHLTPGIRELLSNGLPEISIVWQERFGDETIMRKARIDYLGPNAIVEAKKFGPAPQKSLIRHVLGEAAKYGYDMQAVNSARAVAQIPQLLAEGRVTASHSSKIDLLAKMADHEREFYWLFIRTPGAPCVIAPHFERDGLVWGAAEDKVHLAISNYLTFRERFGDDIWFRSEGLVTPDISDFPIWMTEYPG